MKQSFLFQLMKHSQQTVEEKKINERNLQKKNDFFYEKKNSEFQRKNRCP